MKRLRIEASSVRVPSGSWVRDTVSSLPERDITDKTERAMDSTLKELRGFGVFNQPVVCGMDKHRSRGTTMGWSPSSRVGGGRRGR